MSVKRNVLYSALLGVTFGAIVGVLFVAWRLHVVAELWAVKDRSWWGVLNAYPELRYAIAFAMCICLLVGAGVGAFLGWATHRPKDPA